MKLENIKYQVATKEDLDQVEELQKKYHVDTISEEDKKDGFVTTLFTREQFEELIEKEKGLIIAKDKNKVVAYAMSASWDYWEAWPLFRHMIKDLDDTEFNGQKLTTKNSYQYGPVCIDKEYRGMGIIENIFEYSRRQFKDRYKVMLTFINKINPRSLYTHTEKLGMEIIKTFEFNDNNYYELGYDMDVKTKNSNI